MYRLVRKTPMGSYVVLGRFPTEEAARTIAQAMVRDSEWLECETLLVVDYGLTENPQGVIGEYGRPPAMS
jgi:hypothetical protein